LLLALYRRRPESKRRPGRPITREEYLDDAAARRMTYSPDGRRLFRWSSFSAVRRQLDEALRLEKVDADFAAQVAFYFEALGRPATTTTTASLVFSNMDDALAYLRALERAKSQNDAT
jgi:hypothetical protein